MLITKLLTNFCIDMNDLRIEKKFIFGKGKENNLKISLLKNGFSEIFKPRQISSIYLDTENFDFARDNINGVSKRKKIRFRWYNRDLRNIYLEEKAKQNFQVNKIVKKINAEIDKDYIVRDLKKYFYEVKNRFNSFNYQFVLNVNYLRSYWISDNKKYRATIDQNLIINPINNLSFNLNLNETILEFKFLPKYESSFRDFYYKKNFNFRAKKFSKYIQSFNLLEDSGLIT
tara:strand:- start:223 stop:912 length:690 start_codon:yes stop_codon:yes gene_type:complete